MAQPRDPEMFGYFGSLRAGGDEGSNGTGVAFGGSALFPIRSRLAVEADYWHGRVNSSGDQAFAPEHVRLRSHSVTGNLLYRAGNVRHYFFVGGGIGLHRLGSVLTARTGSHGVPFGATRIDALRHEFRYADTKGTINVRAGFVATLRGSLLMRAEYYQIHRYVLPDAGVRAGLGWRFKR